jgi:hypothetical protein
MNEWVFILYVEIKLFTFKSEHPDQIAETSGSIAKYHSLAKCVELELSTFARTFSTLCKPRDKSKTLELLA